MVDNEKVDELMITMEEKLEKTASVLREEFSNIRANPVPQRVPFPGIRAKRLRFVAERTLEPSNLLKVAEFGILSGD